MKGKRIFLMVSAILLVLSIVLASCGGSDPKSLAKQVYDVERELDEAGGVYSVGADSPQGTKYFDLLEKADKLSPEDKKIFGEELNRLYAQGD